MESAEEPKKTIKSRLSQQLPHPRLWIGLIIVLSLMMIATLIIAVPFMLEIQAFNKMSEDSLQDTMAYYSAESGIADVMWRFKQQKAPFTPTSAMESSYDLPEKLNNMTVQVKLLKYTRIGSADFYIVQSTAPPDPKSRSKITVEIQQDGTKTTLTKYSIQ
jgi:Tfp pilus assembly protein PilX